MRSPRRRLLLIVLVLGLASYGLYRGLVTKSHKAAESGVLFGTGTVETLTVDVSPTVPGKLAVVAVDEGTIVHKGDLIARLDTRSLEAQKTQAEAALRAAEAALRRAEKGPRAEQIEAAMAEADAAEAAVRPARARLDELKAGARPQERQKAEAALRAAESSLEGARRAWETARAQHETVTELRQQRDAAKAAYEAALAAQRRAEAQLSLVQAGPRTEQIDRAEAAVRAAETAREHAASRYERISRLFDEGAVSRQQLDDARAARDAAEAQLASAKAQLEELRRGARPEEIAAAQAALEQARAQVAGAEQTLKNATQAYEDRLRARAELEAAETRLRVARSQRDQVREQTSLVKEGAREEEIRIAEAALRQAEGQARAARARLELLRKGERDEVIDAARAEVERARGKLAQARVALEDAVLLAPCDGTVAEVIADAGEVVNAGAPVVRLLDLDHPYVKIYLPLPQFGKVKLGQTATVRSDAFPEKGYPARVVEIAPEAEFTPKNVQTREQRVQLVFWVKLNIQNAHGELKPGMPVEAEIYVSPEVSTDGKTSR